MSAEKLRNIAKIPEMAELLGSMGVEVLNEIADSYSDMHEALKDFCADCCDYDLCKTCKNGKALRKAEGK